jgi:hypothetical protein
MKLKWILSAVFASVQFGIAARAQDTTAGAVTNSDIVSLKKEIQALEKK